VDRPTIKSDILDISQQVQFCLKFERRITVTDSARRGRTGQAEKEAHLIDVAGLDRRWRKIESFESLNPSITETVLQLAGQQRISGARHWFVARVGKK
jgi:hypothetical protein